MNSEQLRKYIAIAEHKTMTEAAESLFVTQSALSHTLSDLEEELGCKLFTRAKKNLIITTSGQKLLQYAREITSLINQAELELNHQDKLNIAAVNVCAAYMLRYFPEEKLSGIGLLHISESDMPLALLKNDADVIACDDFYIKHYKIPGLRKFVLCREQLGLQVPEGHKFYGRKFITFADLEDEPLCIRADFPSLKTWLNNIETMTGIKFRIELNMDRYTYLNIRDKIDYPEIKQLSSISNINYPLTKNYRFVRIKDVYSSRFIYMWYLSGNEAKVSTLIESVKNYYSMPSNYPNTLSDLKL